MGKYDKNLSYTQFINIVVPTVENIELYKEMKKKAEAFDIVNNKNINIENFKSLIHVAESMTQTKYYNMLNSMIQSDYYNILQKDFSLTDEEFKILMEVLCDE